MNISAVIWMNLISILVLAFSLSEYANAQIVPPTNSTNSTGSAEATGNIASVRSSVAIQVTNSTMKTNEATLKSAINSFLNAGADVLKTSDSYQLNIQTKIVNQITNATQNVQGTEATNAIVGVELGKALKTVTSPSDLQKSAAVIRVETASTCKDSAGNFINCDNSITIK